MAQFLFDKSVKEVTRLDGPLPNAPAPRWKRKAQETLLRVHPSDKGFSTPGRPANFTGRTPGKTCRTTPSRARTPGMNPDTPGFGTSKTPKTTPGRHVGDKSLRSTPGVRITGRTPNRKVNITPGRQLDRFIPNRVTTNQDVSHFALMNAFSGGGDEEKDGGIKVNNPQYVQHLTEAMLNKPSQNGSKILSFRNQCFVQNQPNNLNVLYTTGKVPATKQAAVRYIPTKPENVLDAPAVQDDYYLNTIDWSSKNVIATALGSDVYLWNATDASITLLTSVDSNEYVSSVSWITEGTVLAIGLSDGSVQLWDVNQTKLVRTMLGHSGRVSCLDWNSHILSSGCRSGSIHHHDVRKASHHVATLDSHAQEVCGLRWSPDGVQLASGGNDNAVNIWDTSLGMAVAPLFTFTEHQAAVKALSWCPWKSRLLSTGGGTGDRQIRFWNTNAGICIKTVDTKSQVCSILWSNEHREIVSGHGYSMNQLSLWKYPSMAKITDLTGHSARILNLCMSPDGQTVASIAADETIRLWKCFIQDKKEKKPKSVTKSGPPSSLRMSIR